MPFIRPNLGGKEITEADLAKLAVHSGLAGEIQNLNNVLALNRLSHYVGPYLDLDYLIEATMVIPCKARPVSSITSSQALVQPRQRISLSYAQRCQAMVR